MSDIWQALARAVGMSARDMEIRASRMVLNWHSPIEVGPPDYVICRLCRCGTPWPCEHAARAADRIDALEDR